jgi:hypothetical protein
LGQYLFDDSHASVVVINYPPYVEVSIQTIIAEGSHPDCVAGAPGGKCTVVPSYSTADLTNNQRTLSTTARSVANYRITGGGGGGGGGGCNLSTPTAVTGFLVASCSPFPYTQHQIAWLDNCPAASSHYEIWYSQPDGQPYIQGWTTTVSNTPAYVSGANARVKVSACNGAICTPLSASSYLAVDGC